MCEELDIIGGRRRDPSRLLQIWERQFHQPPMVGRLQIVPVHPRQLLRVEHAGAVPNVLEPETPRQLAERKQLFTFSRRPSDQRQVVGERLWKIAAIAKLL